LIQAATDTHLWAKDYDQDLSDVLTLEADVARAIARGRFRYK
jgi:TolB-like protein